MGVLQRFSIRAMLFTGSLLMVACTSVPNDSGHAAGSARPQSERAPAETKPKEKESVQAKEPVIERESDASPKPALPAKKIIVPEKPAEPAARPRQTAKTKAPAPVAEKSAVENESPVAATSQATAGGTVAGRIRLLGKDGEAVDSSGVIINLEPVDQVKSAKQTVREHIINMEDKTYTPGVLNIQTNDTLSFINGDKIKHNVFSSSGDNSFDLGTYGTGKTRSVKLGSSGIVKVYCNIHPEMATFVNVSEYNLATITDANGSFEIASVPAGRYKVRIWHVRGEMERDLTVRAGMPAKLELIMDTSSYQRIPHKNKFGKDYKKKPALFEDEFY